MNGAAKKSRTTLADLIAELKESEAQDNADDIVSASELHMMDGDHVASPNGNEYRLNEWSRQQLARLLGVKWQRWFADADGQDIADEVNCRLARTRGVVRLRSRRARGGENELRAVVSPTFGAIQDSTVATALQTAVAVVDPDMPVLRFAMSERSTTIMVGVGQPYRPGGDGRVGDLFGAVTIRNSGTGYAALACHLSLLRLVCLNGMMMPHEDAVVLRRVHRGLHPAALEERLYSKLRGLPARLRSGADVVAQSVQVVVDDVDEEIRQFLVDAHLPQRHAAAVRAAYDREPHASVFGISQGITLAAQKLVSEERYELELAAGEYVRARLKLAA